MAGDRELVQLAQLGIPATLNYEGLRKKPFWRLREKLALDLLTIRQESEIVRGMLIQSSGAQGYPGENTNVEVATSSYKRAFNDARRYACTIQPWKKFEDFMSEKEQKERLLGESADMIEAWIARFEPENLEAYREEVKRAMEEAQTDAE